jgi:hypothetical protein
MDENDLQNFAGTIGDGEVLLDFNEEYRMLGVE